MVRVMSVTYAQLGKSAIVTYELIRRDIFAEEKTTNELLGRLAMDIVGATGYEGEYVIKLWRTIDKDPFSQQNRIDVCADVAPVRHGHWIDDAGALRCSECGVSFPDLHPLYENAAYCPNCGARMDGDKSDD